MTNSILKPGTCVQLVGLTGTGKQFNNQFALVKKYLDKTSKYRVLLGKGDTDIAVTRNSLKVLQQCQNEVKENRTGYIIWPKIAKNDKPCIQWIEDDGDLTEFYEDWEKNATASVRARAHLSPPMHSLVGSVVRFGIDRLGWNYNSINNRRSWCMRSPEVGSREMFYVMWDDKNKSKSNVWFENCFQPFLTHQVPVKGPIIVYKWFNKNEPNFRVSLNFHKTNMIGVGKYIKNPVKTSRNEFVKFETAQYAEISNIDRPSNCCFIDDCDCTKSIASADNKKFLQKSALSARIIAQHVQFEAVRNKTNTVFNGPKFVGLHGVQE